jgi:hypothetical protein
LAAAFLATTFFSATTGTSAGTGVSTTTATVAFGAATFLATLEGAAELIIPVVGVFVEDILRTTYFRG